MTINVEWLAKEFPQLSNIENLGEGGQKWVFLCNHLVYKLCVLKLIKPGAEYYLDREIEAVERISKYVPSTYEIGTRESSMGPLVWIFEEFVDGIPLMDIIKDEPLNKQKILKLALDLITIAAEGESNKVVHRDIKPGNIKIDGNGNAWLLDFGIARILDMDSKTQTDAISGPHSPGYSAPEQFIYRKRDIDGRSDLFAIGVTIYESVTGRNPFLEGARDRLEVLKRVEKDPLPILDLPWDPEGRFSVYIISLTQKFPHHRPNSCKEALVWLQEIIENIGGE